MESLYPKMNAFRPLKMIGPIILKFELMSIHCFFYIKRHRALDIEHTDRMTLHISMSTGLAESLQILTQ